MNQRFFFSLTLFAAISTIAILPPVEAQTRIGTLQQGAARITVSGQIISIAGNHFLLEDGTGQLIVDAGPRWWREVNIDPGERVRVTGELGKKGEFDAFSIIREDGSVIEIRPHVGPPPWAGSFNSNPQLR